MRYAKLLWLITLFFVYQLCNGQNGKSVTSDHRLQKLNTLAEIWGDLAIHHPNLAGKEKMWDSVLSAAIPFVEETKTIEDFANVLNARLFSSLGDPFSYASTLSQTPDTSSVHINSKEFTVLKLNDEVGYIAVPIPFEYGVDFTRQLYNSIQSFGEIKRLLIDLRSVSKTSYSSNWLSLWTDKELNIGPTYTPVYWYYNTNGLYWLAKPMGSLKSISFLKSGLKKTYPNEQTANWNVITTPTVFIVNCNSYPMFAETLDVLQAQNNIAVILDSTGIIKGGDLLYSKNIRVNINSEMVLAHDGALGVRPDTVLQNILITQLIKLSNDVLNKKRAFKYLRSPFQITTLPDYRPQTSTSLTREQKLLGLMKIWVNIKHFYAYPEHMTIDWEHMLYDWISKVERTINSGEYYSILQEVTSKINDSHVWFWHPILALLPDAKSLSRTIPALLLKVQGKVVVAQIDSVAGRKFPLTIGDEILAINGKSIAEIETYWRKRVSAAQESGFIRNVWEYAYAIRGSSDSIVTMLVQGKNGKKEIKLKKTEDIQDVASTHPFDKKIIELLPNNIGFIRLYHVRNVLELDSALSKFKNTRGLIFDLRGGNAPLNYRFPGDMRTILIDRLVEQPFERKGTQLIYQFTDGEPVQAKVSYSGYYFPDTSGKNFYDKPIVVITTSRQQSYGEGIFQILQAAGRVTFVGSPTAGTNGGMADIKLPDGGGLTFTQVYLSQQDGKPFHGVGIVPDVSIEPTIRGIRNRKDEVLEKAIETLNKKIKDFND
jgi:C-terminal processing protease CtpA/Prc